MAQALDQEAVWKGDFKVHSYEVDFKKSATLESLCCYFQEAAWNHAEQLGVGYERLQAENRAWVLSRLLVEVTRYPSWAEIVCVHTWPCLSKSVFAMRDFEILDLQGRKLVAGASAWLLLDTETKRPQRVDKLIQEIQIPFRDRRALTHEPKKLNACAADAAGIQFNVSYSDIDVNGHVNNSRYIGWLMDAQPIDLHRKSTVKSLEMNYLSEAIAGDKLSLLSSMSEPGEFLHSIFKADGTEVCRAKVAWDGFLS